MKGGDSMEITTRMSTSRFPLILKEVVTYASGTPMAMTRTVAQSTTFKLLNRDLR